MTAGQDLRIDQAIFGEVQAGHALRLASGDRQLASQLAPRLDLPDTAPPGVDWSPFVSGFPFNDCYIIARTFKDVGATRSGMVFAHALVAPLDALVSQPDIGPLFARLLSHPDMPAELPSFQIDAATAPIGEADELRAVAALLVQRGSGAVVRLGYEDFEPLAMALWAGMTPAMRRGFAFRLSFGPNDLVETPAPALVCTPRSLVGRWQGYRVVDKAQPFEPSPAADLLSGLSGGLPLAAFGKSVGAETASFSDLTLLEQAYRLAEVEAETFGNLIAALRLTQRLSPSQTHGSAGKNRLLDRAIQHVAKASAGDVLLLRNLDISGFEAARLWASLRRWGALNQFSSSEDGAFVSVLGALGDPQAANEAWRTAITQGLADASAKTPKAIAAAFWRWVAREPAVITPLWQALAPKAKFADELVRVAPTALAKSTAKSLLALAAAAKLYRLHGVAAALSFEPAVAAAEQVAFEPASADAGVRLSLRSATPAEVVAIAIKIVDPRLIKIAGEHAGRTPSLLRLLDYSRSAARDVWSQAIALRPAAWCGPADPAAAFALVLDDQLAGHDASTGLLDQLSETDLADVMGYTRRAELWTLLPQAAQRRMLVATAAAWVRGANAGSPSPVESALEAAILASPELDALLAKLSRESPARAAQIFSVLPSFSESRFRPWLRSALNTGLALSLTNAEALGRLVEARGWRASAEDLLNALRQGRDDVRPGLRLCQGLLSSWDRWWNGLAPVSADEKWATLEATACDLFPTGPDDAGLWERAGGHNADLNTTGNGRSRWRDALQRIRRGARGPKIDKLMREMQKDFPQNPTLTFLAKDNEFGG